MNHAKPATVGLFLVLFVIGCGQSAPEPPAAMSEAPAAAEAPPAAAEMPPAMPPLPDLATRLAAESRSADDRARDAGRKPSEVLEFLGVEPGMSVLDLVAASGWYTEVLAIAVGESGSVTAQNPPWMLAFRDGAAAVALDERIGDRLDNVTRLDSTWAELADMPLEFDLALSALNIHDVYYMESPEATADFAAAIYSVLKPGGVLGIIDHAGDAEADNATMHRIDKQAVIDIVTGAGFVLEAESDLLANPDDDHSQGVFSEGIRGRTDRFLLRFRKPE